MMPLAPHTTVYTLDGVSLSVATWGQYTQSNRVVVLVHGLTANHLEWQELGPLLAEQGWYVIAPDLRGRGLSSKPPHGYGIAYHATDLLTLCDRLNLASVTLVGHSLGAVIALYMAALYPSRVQKLVMIDAGGTIPEDTAQAIGASVARLGTVYPSLAAYLDTMRSLPMIHWNAFWEAYFRYDAHVQSDGQVTSRVPKAAIEEENAVLAMTRTEELPHLVKQPTLIVRATVGLLGGDRGMILPVAEAQRLHRIMPASQVVEITGVNHYTMMLDEHLAAAITAFLAEG